MDANVEKLRELSNRENPVEIAGYGRESTHKGYLSWILNSTKNPQAPEFLKALCLNAQVDIEPVASLRDMELPKSCDCMWERRLEAGGTIDLVAIACWDSQEYAIPIELKSDSGSSSEKQFERLSASKTFDGTQIADRLVLCLGSASALYLNPKNFGRCNLNSIVAAAGACEPQKKRFFVDWAEAVQAENLRQRIAISALGAIEAGDYGIGTLGYRTERHLLFFVLGQLKEKLEDRMSSCTWSLYSSGHNTVLNHEVGDGEWYRTREIDGNLFFEFNDRALVLKLRNGEYPEGGSRKAQSVAPPNDPAKVAEVIESIGRAVLECNPKSRVVPDARRTRRSQGTYRSIVKWKFDLTRQDEVVEAVYEIMSKCGPDGFLAKYVHSR